LTVSGDVASPAVSIVPVLVRALQYNCSHVLFSRSVMQQKSCQKTGRKRLFVEINSQGATIARIAEDKNCE
jgi:hypothetical protein